MNSELYGRDPERMGHRVLDDLRALVDEQANAARRLRDAEELVHAPLLRRSLRAQAAHRVAYADALARHAPALRADDDDTGAASDAASQDGLAASAERLWTAARAKLSPDEDAAVRAELHRHDERTLRHYADLLERAEEPNLVGILQRQRTAIQEWTERLSSPSAPSEPARSEPHA